MLKYLLGDIDPMYFVACFIFSMLGVLFILLMGTTLRDVNSKDSPKQFSWKYLWNDNLKRIMANIIAVLVTLRFMTEITGWELSMWKAFVVGVGWDSIGLLIKQKTGWFDPKPKE